MPLALENKLRNIIGSAIKRFHIICLATEKLHLIGPHILAVT